MRISRRGFLGAGAAAAVPNLASRLVRALAPDAVSPHVLWYGAPATRWFEALPLGNGHLGAMVFGSIDLERIALSESTVWSGAPDHDAVNPGARDHLGLIRELLFAGRYGEARSLCQEYLLAKPHNFGTNLPLPELQLAFPKPKSVSSYRRSLDLDSGLARSEYRSAGARFMREAFASHPDRVLVVHIRCDQPQSVDFRISFGKAIMPVTVETNEVQTLILRGKAFETLHSSGHDGVQFEAHVRVVLQGGSLMPVENALEVKSATAATVLVAIATNFAGNRPIAECEQILERAAAKEYQALRSAHTVDHQALYRRVSLDIGKSSDEQRAKPINLRRASLGEGADDPELLALFFQYGRYLTIAGSREDSALPLALQGIWNDGLASSMGWTDDFHLDINTQQNYWAAEVCNLGECQLPLFRWIEVLRESGRKTAREMYGAPGWVAHTVSNPWGYSAPGWGIGWGLFVSAGTWISLQLWEHYRFHPDDQFLRATAYPVLRELAEFYLAYLVSDPTHGWLVAGPSDSPENWYKTPDGGNAAESMGNTCDRALVFALFSTCIEASQILGIDKELRLKWSRAQAQLSPFQIGRHGQLQEWLCDFEDADPNHRHTSHLVALYPLHEISPHGTPELARAAKVTLERRMQAPHWEQTEWGWANLVAYSARLLDGDKAHKYLTGLVANAAEDNLLTYSIAGVAGAGQNIFALDGNTAGTAAMAEMLVQSQASEIVLLPALPRAWLNGSVRGLRARGGFEVDVRWRDGVLQGAEIRSVQGGIIPVRYGEGLVHARVVAGIPLRLRARDFLSTI
jgi:alpha-L-fucosidase 2